MEDNFATRRVNLACDRCDVVFRTDMELRSGEFFSEDENTIKLIAKHHRISAEGSIVGGHDKLNIIGTKEERIGHVDVHGTEPYCWHVTIY